MGVQMRIGHAVHRPRREMDELAPDHVARAAVLVLAAFADAGGHFCFHVVHRAVDRIAERIENPFVARHRIEQRDAFGHVEIEIVADRPIRSQAGRQLLAGLRIDVVAERIPVGLLHVALQSKPAGSLATPAAGEFLSLGIIVGRRVVTLRAIHMRVLRDAQHPSLYGPNR